jgi:hypothetical protein
MLVVTENHIQLHQDRLTLRLRHKRQATHPWPEARYIPTVLEPPSRYLSTRVTVTATTSNMRTVPMIRA